MSRSLRNLYLGFGLALAIGGQAQGAALGDPTQPATQTGGASSGMNNNAGLQLNAIFLHNSDRYAIINGVKRHAGERFDGIRLLHIQHHSVTIESAGMQQTLRLNTHTVKTQR